MYGVLLFFCSLSISAWHGVWVGKNGWWGVCVCFLVGLSVGILVSCTILIVWCNVENKQCTNEPFVYGMVKSCAMCCDVLETCRWKLL